MKTTLIKSAILSALCLSPLAVAHQAGDILVRGGLTNVAPDSGSAGVNLDGNALPLSLSVDDNSQLGLNFVYFYDNNWAIEVLAATPFTHDVTLNDPTGATEAIYGIDLNGAKFAEVTHLPPTVSALYYFDSNSAFKPYVGAGLNYTIFFDEKFTTTPTAAGFSNLELDGSFGWSLQVGADYVINDKWHVNASVRYIDIDTDASFDVTDALGVGGLAGQGSASIDVDPMVYSLMIGYKF
ncbi:OmpW/AlkL family protein [Thalassotalea sp. PLHSN55]|uniref:OmpW/AlkL family protein n=1 Tax=Thalassotalea sp. PLHSN55 TaxID=3435888 RepID=UPI003F850901